MATSGQTGAAVSKPLILLRVYEENEERLSRDLLTSNTFYHFCWHEPMRVGFSKSDIWVKLYAVVPAPGFLIFDLESQSPGRFCQVAPAVNLSIFYAGWSQPFLTSLKLKPHS